MAKAIKQRNPLAVCWGMLLRATREGRGWEYSDIEKMSGLSPDFYRNIERAVYNLHVSQAIPLFNTFKNDVIGETFSLDGIIQILSVISLMEVRANEKIRNYKAESTVGETSAYYSSLYETAVELSDHSPKWRKLLTKFFNADVFVEFSDNELFLEKIRKYDLISEVEDFILHYNRYGENESDSKPYSLRYIESFFDNVPSIYTDFITETKRNLLALPVRIIFSELQNWERSNEAKIEELYVIVASKFDVTNISNLEKYHYSYLFEKDFTKARFLIVDSLRDDKDIKEEFDYNLDVAYKKVKKKQPKNWKQGLSKMRFKVLATLAPDLSDILVLNKGSVNEEKFDCFWVFKFIDGTLIGFVANAVKANDFEDTQQYIFYEGRSLLIPDIPHRYALLKSYFR